MLLPRYASRGEVLRLLCIHFFFHYVIVYNTKCLNENSEKLVSLVFNTSSYEIEFVKVSFC